MATDKVYQYLTAFLAGEMRKGYPKFDVGLGYGAKDNKPNKGKVAHLCELIENSVFGKRVAYVDADGCAYAYNGEYYESDGEWLPLSTLEQDYKQYCDEHTDPMMKGRVVSPLLRSVGVKEKKLSNGLHFLVGRKKIENENNE